MFFYYKKILAIITSFFYILVNYNFYNSIFHEYTNDRIFQITLWLGIVEVLFWIMLLYSVFYLENRSISDNLEGKSKETVELEERRDIRDLLICFSIFLVSLICVNISRVILQSSPYMNDVVSTVNSYDFFNNSIYFYCSKQKKCIFNFHFSIKYGSFSNDLAGL